MTEPAGATTFVVGLDRDTVLRRREVVHKIQWVGGWVSAILAAIGVVLAVIFVVYAVFVHPGADMWPFALLMLLSVLPLAVINARSLRLTADRKRWFAAAELPRFAMRMSPSALELGVEGAPAPVVLPWDVVKGFKVRQPFGEPVLEIALNPGVSGLDHPAAKAALQPKRMLRSPGFVAVAALDQSVEAIDAALRQFSGGRTAILR
ncbi:hypothetical protein OG394_16885 [Kribbella sp. NBC_01245]|uniref:hypothetical protein n=1 Tax=Kribbella sp. NBC_01245 TaxID=2903578 RepID=UPI002E29554E|nr:hypothetical protein [Kribbella sp. NBC_01245]